MRQRKQREDVRAALHSLDQRLQGGGIGVIPLGGQPGQREVMPHQVLDQLSVALVEPDRLDRFTCDRRAACRVVDTSAGQLADVVEEAGQQQDVGPIDTSQMRLHLGHCLH